jgi:Fe-S cluster biosynthesis and repair protein YggX
MTHDNTSDQVPPAKEPRLVDCVVLHERLPGLPAPPFPTPLGQRIVASVSQQAWNQWLEHSKRLINEFNLKLSEPAARAFLQKACEAYLFEGKQEPPEGWEPQGDGFIPIVKKPR